MICNYFEYLSKGDSSWISLSVFSKDWVDFAMLFPLRESRGASDPALSRDRGRQLQLHPRRLDSEALRLLQRWVFYATCLKHISGAKSTFKKIHLLIF